MVIGLGLAVDVRSHLSTDSIAPTADEVCRPALVGPRAASLLIISMTSSLIHGSLT